MKIKAIKGNLLFWKILSVFSILLILLGIVFIIIASRFSESYLTSTHQELYGDIAKHLATLQPIKNGKPDTLVTHDIIHSTMVANPSVEVYLLDTSGNITDYVVPDATVQIHKVNISKVKQWLKSTEIQKPMGDNPKQPDNPSIFSAAPIYEKGKLSGYVYAVLASERQKKILLSLNNSFYKKLSISIFFTALLVVFIVGVITFFLITGSISKIVSVVKRFKEGDYSARIEDKAKGELAMLSSTFNDMADVIVENIDRITATDKFRQELIANVSHDLRTPLSIMQGYLETLRIKEDTLTEKEKAKYLLIVHDSTKKLSTLIDQLFQYAKLEANIIVPEKERFRIDELASDIITTYQLKADKRNISLQLEASHSSSLSVFADIALTERVLQNLLNNAFKFTPDGGNITIQLKEYNDLVKVQVRDSGIGITTEDQQYIFERYKQLEKEGVTKNGMGIGLAIVKKILELHQSTIEVTSKLGEGSVFQFSLPKNFVN